MRLGRWAIALSVVVSMTIATGSAAGATPSAALSVPSSVTEVHVTARTSTTVSLSWTLADPSDPNVVDFLVEYLPSQDDWTVFVHDPSATAAITVTGLAANTPYQFRVSSVAIDGETSSPVLATYAVRYAGAGGLIGSAGASCTLDDWGSIQCWGETTGIYGTSGLLGNGAKMRSDTPVLAHLPEKANSLAVGPSGSCAVGESGRVYCWGRVFGTFGGVGDPGISLVPTPQPGIRNAVKVSASTFGQYNDVSTACAVTSDSHGYCWGWGEQGQWGSGSVGQLRLVGGLASGGAPLRATEPAGVGFTDVSTSGLATCFIGTDTHLYCTGDNTYGQLGIGTPAAPTVIPTEVTLANGAAMSGVTSVFLSEKFTCAVAAGDVYCWGDNATGRLGLGSTTSYTHPRRVSDGWQATQVAMWREGGCALTTTATLKCWGSGDNIGALADSSLSPIDAYPPDRTYSMLQAGQSSVCAVATSGSPYCWGDFGGALGFQGHRARGINVPVDPWVSTLAVGAPGGIALSPSTARPGKTITITGDNVARAGRVQLGEKDVDFAVEGSALTFALPDWAEYDTPYAVTVTSGGGSATSASTIMIPRTEPAAPDVVLMTHRTATTATLSWTASVSNGTPVTGYEVEYSVTGDEPWTHAATVEAETLTYTLSGLDPSRTYAVRIKATSALGDSSGAVKVIIAASDHPEAQVRDVALGDYHACVVDELGGLSCTGIASARGANLVPEGLGPVRSVSAAFATHTCVLLEAGTVRCWGANDNGAIDVPTDLTGVKAMSSSWAGTCVIRHDDSLRCWGWIKDGIPAAALTHVRKVTLGKSHACVLNATSTPACWGWDAESRASGPMAISDAIDIAAGEAQTCVVRATHAVQCWGWDQDSRNYFGPSVGTVTAIAAGWGTNCLLQDAGELLCSRGVKPFPGRAFKRVAVGSGGYCAIDASKDLACSRELAIPMRFNTRLRVTGVAARVEGPSARVSWTASPDTIGSIAIELSTDGGHTWRRLSSDECTIETSGNSALVGLPAFGYDTEVSFRVLQVSGADTGPASEPSGEVMILRQPPGKPGDLRATGKTATSVSVAWDESADRGVAVTGYRLEYAVAGGTWIATSVTDAAARTAAITGLASATGYLVRVTPLSDAGDGASATVTARTSNPPAAPGGLAQSARSSSSVTVGWSAATPDEGAPVTGYRVEYSTDGGSWTSFATPGAGARSVVVTGLASASRYQVRVTATSAAGDGPSAVADAFTSGTRTTRIRVRTASGAEVTGGAVRWVSGDGTLESARAVGLTASGVADLQRVPAGPVRIRVADAVLPGGVQVSGSWTVFLGSADQQVLVVPDPPGSGQRIVGVTLPGGLPVAGASVRVSGLARVASRAGFDYAVDSVQSGSTGSDGRFTATGFATSGTPTADVEYNDGDLIQRRFDVPLGGVTTTVELDEMPWLDVAQDQVTAGLNDLVPVMITATETQAMLGRSFSAGLSGVTVRIIPPAGAKQSCKGRKLSTTTDSRGTARLAICASKSGTYTIAGQGAVATSALTLRVTGAAPTPVTALTADSPSAGQLRATWNPPVFTGGRGYPITGYTLTLAGGKKPVTVTLTKPAQLAARSYTFKDLASATSYTVTVTAINKTGPSDPMRATTGIA